MTKTVIFPHLSSAATSVLVAHRYSGMPKPKRRPATGFAQAASIVALASGWAKPVDKELVGTRGIDKIAADQKAVAQHEREGRELRNAAVRDLVQLSQETIVLGHIQPRWLRQEVEAMLDGELEVTPEIIALLRKRGPQ